MARAKKGTVTVHSFRGMLRLNLPRQWFNGDKKFLSLGLSDTPDNHLIATAKANLMMHDYIYGDFDFSLSKYRLESAPEAEKMDIKDLFDKYFEHKSHSLTKGSMRNLRTVQIKLSNMPEGIVTEAKNIKSWLIEHHSLEQSRRCLVQLKACCDWAMEQNLIVENPFENLKKIKPKAKSLPDPFTINERDIIIAKFYSECSYFAPFVEFLFFTGCRPSEAIALKWANVDFDNRYILFCEAIVEREVQHSTKTGKDRKFPINAQLEKVLRKCEADGSLVFLSQKKTAIDIHNFSNRIWTPLLKKTDVRHRGCYHCRHTFITLCLDQNIPIQQVANWVGNSPEIILRHYAGLTRSEVPIL